MLQLSATDSTDKYLSTNASAPPHRPEDLIVCIPDITVVKKQGASLCFSAKNHDRNMKFDTH